MYHKYTHFLFATALLLPLGATSAASQKCTDILVVTCRGTTEPQNPEGATPSISSVGGVVVTSNGNATTPQNSLTLVHGDPDTGEGKIGYVAIEFEKRFKGTSVTIAREAVLYPASNEDPGDFNKSFTAGYDNLVGIIEKSSKTCKEQKIVLLGYSQGAMVVGDVLSGPGGTLYGPVQKPDLSPEKYADGVLAVVLWADIRHNNTGQSSFTRGFPVGKKDGYFPRTEEQDDILIKYYGKKIVSFCNTQDRFCSSGAFEKDANKTIVEVVPGLNATEGDYVHERSYLKTSMNASVDFLIENAEAAGFKAANGPGGNETSPSTSTSAGASPTGTGASAAGRAERWSTTGVVLVLAMLVGGLL